MSDDNTNIDDSTTPGNSGSDPLGIIGWEVGGKYIISSYIGGGGFGEVYQGYNKNLPDQRLVFKFFKRVQSRDKFDKEARILCLLDHPNISRVIDYLPEEGAVVVAFIDGQDGSQILKESGAISEDLFLKVIKALTSAVAYAHHKNIAHRDLKPGNVMFDKNDHIYLIDFGIAKEIGSQATKTAYQALTPMFAAPERQDGEADYDPFLSDIFETGVTLYNFATNDLPYRNPANPNYNEWGGASAEKLSPELTSILKKATHPVPGMRYKNANEMADEVKTLKRAYGRDLKAVSTKGKKGGKIWLVVVILAVIASATYYGRNQIIQYYGQLTAEEEKISEPAETKLKSVIDSIIGLPETIDTTQSAQIDTGPLVTESEKILDAKKPGDPSNLKVEKEAVEPEKVKKAPPAEEKPSEKVKKPVEEQVITVSKNAMTVTTQPDNLTLLAVDGIKASKDSTFMLKFGNHSVVVYHPEYPIFRKTVYMPKKSRTIEIDLIEEFTATAWANLQIALSPPSENHFIELSFNGKSHTLSAFPELDLKKLKGAWLVETAIYDVSGEEGKNPKIDSLVTYPYGDGERSLVKGGRGEINLGAKDWNDETVPFLIFWSEK